MIRRAVVIAAMTLGVVSAADVPETLAGTTRWNVPADISAEQYRELRSFYEHQIAEAANRRHSAGAKQASRAEFRALIGAIEEFLAPRPEVEAVADFGSF